MKTKSILLVTLFLFLLGSNANAYVETWDYGLSGVFINTTLTNGGTLADGLTTLTWGTTYWGDPKSSLVIDPSTVNDQVDTYVGGGTVPSLYWADSIDLTHNNNPIYEPSLASTTLQVSVLLDPFVPDNPALPNQIFTFGIDFTETPNIGGLAEYDIFALLDGFPNFNFQYDALDGDGLQTYYVNVFPSTGGVLSALSPLYASLAGVPVGTLGFATPEGQSTTLGFSFTISTEPLTNPVPEPATMILFGTGVLGIAMVARKKFIR